VDPPTPSEIRDGVTRLPDGRRMAYAEWGPLDAPAVVYCHGFPGSRREIRLSAPIAERHGIRARVVAMNRPGYGESTFRRGRTFLDWPQDVAAVADILGIDRFAVLGASGGAPYALACAVTLGNRVTRTGIVVGVAPIEASGMQATPTMTAWSAKRLIRRVQFEVGAAAARWGSRERFMDQVLSSLGEADRRVMERPEVRAWFLEVAREAYARGGRAAAYEARLLRSAWGFDLGEVPPGALLWYAGGDRWVPASAGRWMAERLPGSVFTLWPDHGHFSWAASDEAAVVLESLAAE
jgi:pimeloyl-ACP methyl ester carboxylesterase